MPNLLRKIRGFVLDILFPIECLNCHLEGAYLCEKCFHQIRFNDTLDLKRARQNLKTPDLEKIFIAGNYEDKLLRSLIKKYKYGFIKPLGEILARFLITFWKLENEEIETLDFKITKPPKNYIVIPIPLSKKRLRWRGFNQAELIARDFSKYFNYELNLGLTRIKYQRPQAELSETERLENVQSAFTWEEKNQPTNSPSELSILSGRDVLLIDDVATTGATLNEAARILKEAGASSVYALVLAKG